MTFTAVIPEGWVVGSGARGPGPTWVDEWLQALGLPVDAEKSLRFWVDGLTDPAVEESVLAFLVLDPASGCVDARFVAQPWFGSEPESDRDAIGLLWPGAAQLADYLLTEDENDPAPRIAVAHTTARLPIAGAGISVLCEVAATVVRPDPATAVYVELMTLGPSPFEALPFELAALAAAITSEPPEPEHLFPGDEGEPSDAATEGAERV